MTKTLTDKWRDGKLPNGDYYIKVRGNLTKKEFFTYDNCINGKWAYTLDGNVIAVISPVPSYEEYKQLVSKTEQLEKKLDIATKALELYADDGNWCNCLSWNGFMEDNEVVEDGQFGEYGYEPARKALKEMEGVK